MTEPRSALLTGSLSPLAGGLFHSARVPANVMAAAGRSPVVVGIADHQWREARSAWVVDEIRAVRPLGPRAYFSVVALGRELRAANPDVLHLRGLWGPYSLAAWRWRRRTRRPLVISPHGMLDEGAFRYSAGKRRLLAACYEAANLRGASVLHALNASEAASMRRLGLTRPIATIPNGVVIESPRTGRERPADRRREMLFLGRFHPKKGIEELVRAWGIVARSRPELSRGWRLRLAGWDDGGHLASIHQQIASFGLGGQIEFLGPVLGDAKREALERAEAFVLPSHSEGLPISVLEAWERSLPVLMTSACNLPEGFEAGAALKTEASPEPLANALAGLFALSDEARAAMGARGRRLVERRFDWERITREYLALYDWLARRAPRPAFVEDAA